MDDFINLNDSQDSTIIIDTPSIKPKIKPLNFEKEEDSCSVIEIDKIGSITIEEEPEEHICIKDDCDVSSYYGCPSENNGFQKDNLFSELTDEYQRTIARINLGIAEEYALKWGNITGNLLNQKDLYKFVTDQIASDINLVIDEINLKLEQWSNELCEKLKSKADIYSPNFQGEPTTTLPNIYDNSNRIASTEWVNARLQTLITSNNIEYIKVTPEFKYIDEEPVNVQVQWKYKNPIVKQTINNIPIDSQVTTYVFENVNSDFSIVLRYYTEDSQGASAVSFQVKYPIYYGVNPDDINKTTLNILEVDAGTSDYIYLKIPGIENPNISVNGIIGGFISQGFQSMYGTIYYIFRSTNSGLGKTTIVIQDYETESLSDKIKNIEQQLMQINSKSLIMLE